MKQILFRLFENLKQLGIKPNIGSRTNVTPIPGSEIDRLINRPVTPKEFDYSKPEVVDSMRGIIQNASDYVGQFTERQLKTFNDNIERIIGVIKPKETTADVVDLATKEKITGSGLESLMKEKGVPSISRKTIEAETLIKQFLDDDLISLNAKQIDQLSRGKAEDVFENIFGSKAKELITGKNTNESLNEVYNKLKTSKDVKGRLPDDSSFDPSDINFRDGGSVSEDVRQLLKEEFIKIINENPEAYPDTNAGFRRFLKRKGAPVFNYKDGGRIVKRKQEKKDGKLGPTDPLSKYESYSEEELAGNIEAKKPTFETLEDYIMETMPMFEPKDVAPPKSYSPMPVEEYLRRRLFIDLADGGRVSYAEGSKPTREDSPILQINPMERDIQFSQDPTMDQIPNVGIAAIGLTKKAKDYNRYLKAFESNDPKVFKKWFDSQTKEFSKTKKLAEEAEMFEIIPEVARGASKTEKQIANNQLRESMGRYYAQELGPYYSQEVGILDNLIFKAYGGRVSMSDGGLTKTVPPVRGPNPQGVESLFKKR
jgi:hypothetical protein